MEVEAGRVWKANTETKVGRIEQKGNLYETLEGELSGLVGTAEADLTVSENQVRSEQPRKDSTAWPEYLHCHAANVADSSSHIPVPLTSFEAAALDYPAHKTT